MHDDDGDHGSGRNWRENGDKTHIFGKGAFGEYLDFGSTIQVGGHGEVPDGVVGTLIADLRLQNMPDYRAALQLWFGSVRIGGYLIITVPNALFRQPRLARPADEHSHQLRLYSHARLMMEVEEALVPGSYHVHRLGDRGVAALPGDRDIELSRANDDDVIELILQKVDAVAPTAPEVKLVKSAPPPFLVRRTRNERALLPASDRIVILKLDHLGDFILALPALERARALFRAAHITLVVGSWNFDLARSLSVADEVLAFDAFPRNPSEEEVDVPGKRALFERTITGSYDLAIDLRTDGDTRTLLAQVDAPIKAAIGDRVRFPFLGIALPIDLDRGWREQAREDHIDHHAFSSQQPIERLHHRLIAPTDGRYSDGCMIWGPYRRLQPGRYIFDPKFELASGEGGLLMIDVALNTRRVAQRCVERDDPLWLTFEVEKPDSAFEFRVWPVEGATPIGFSFFGGRLMREGVSGTLHQSDYLVLLIELVARRVKELGILVDAGA